MFAESKRENETVSAAKVDVVNVAWPATSDSTTLPPAGLNSLLSVKLPDATAVTLRVSVGTVLPYISCPRTVTVTLAPAVVDVGGVTKVNCAVVPIKH